MARFPYINFPFPFYKDYPQNSAKYHNFSSSPMQHHDSTFQTNTCNTNSTNLSEITNSSNNNDSKQKNKSNKNNSDFLFDLFGLKIYNDDVLLVSLLYFLYSEGVKDDRLFLVLILLLLS